jgi:hypothetical protein
VNQTKQNLAQRRKVGKEVEDDSSGATFLAYFFVPSSNTGTINALSRELSALSWNSKLMAQNSDLTAIT